MRITILLTVAMMLILPACTVYDSRGGGTSTSQSSYSSGSNDDYYRRPAPTPSSTSSTQTRGYLVADVDLGMSLSLFDMYYKIKAGDNVGFMFGVSIPDPMSGIFKLSLEPPEGRMGVYATAGFAYAGKQAAYEYKSGGSAGTFEVDGGMVGIASVGYRAQMGRTTTIHFEIGNGWLVSGGDLIYVSGDDTPEIRDFFEYCAPGGPILVVGIEAGF